jgi:hypothetical protein
MKTVQIANADVRLIDGRRLTGSEKLNKADWYKEIGLIGTGAYINLPRLRWTDVRAVTGTRHSDGSYMGCDNSAWIITEAEWDLLLALNSEREAKLQAEMPQRLREMDDYDIQAARMERIMGPDGGSY